MTKPGTDGETRCRWCQRPLIHPTVGRPRQYCRQSCRQRDYEARRRAAEQGLNEGEIILTRTRLDALRDQLWMLSCAVEDVDGDLERAGPEPGAADLLAALRWLLDAARPLSADFD